jgi:hypothetical protein
MKRLIALVCMSALVAVVPAWAAKPTHPTHPTHPAHPIHPVTGGSKSAHSCSALNKGYGASGTLVSAALTPMFACTARSPSSRMAARAPGLSRRSRFAT